MWRALRARWTIPGARLRLLAFALLPFAIYAYVGAIGLGFAAAWNDADPDAMELAPPERAAHRQVMQREVAALRAESQRGMRLAETLGLLAFAFGIASEWRARHNVRAWPWRSVLALALLAWSSLVEAPWLLRWAVWLIALAFALALLDLWARRPGPSRALAWLTLALAIALGLVRCFGVLH